MLGLIRKPKEASDRADSRQRTHRGRRASDPGSLDRRITEFRFRIRRRNRQTPVRHLSVSFIEVRHRDFRLSQLFIHSIVCFEDPFGEQGAIVQPGIDRHSLENLAEVVAAHRTWQQMRQSVEKLFGGSLFCVGGIVGIG